MTLTVKQKAQQLINLWIDKVHQDGIFYLEPEKRQRINSIECAIACAEMTIDIILNDWIEKEKEEPELLQCEMRSNLIVYWSAVKEELQFELKLEFQK